MTATVSNRSRWVALGVRRRPEYLATNQPAGEDAVLTAQTGEEVVRR